MGSESFKQWLNQEPNNEESNFKDFLNQNPNLDWSEFGKALASAIPERVDYEEYVKRCVKMRMMK